MSDDLEKRHGELLAAMNEAKGRLGQASLDLRKITAELRGVEDLIGARRRAGQRPAAPPPQLPAPAPTVPDRPEALGFHDDLGEELQPPPRQKDRKR